jgi:prophage regulatory protein
MLQDSPEAKAMQSVPQAIRNTFLRIEHACRAKGVSRSVFYVEASAGLTTRPIKIGARASGVPTHEIEALNAARIAGCTDDEIRALVDRLHAARGDAHKSFMSAIDGASAQ